MANYIRELPVEGLARLDVELWRGNITVRPAKAGEVGYLESEWETEVTADGDALFVRQPVDVKRPLGLADVVGEQKVRIEIDGTVLFDKQIRHGGGDVAIVLPSSVRSINCRTAGGDVNLEGTEADVEVHSGRGNLVMSGGRGQAVGTTADGEVKISGWLGPIHVQSGKGNLEMRDVQGDLEAKTGKGEIRIEEAASRVSVHSGHGNLVAGRLSGDSSLSTGHGEVVVTDIDGARLEASTGHGKIAIGGKLAGASIKTAHGDITCRLDAAKGDHEFHTGWGNIALDLEGNVGAQIDASTRRGSIRSNLPLVRVGTTGPEGYFNQRMVGTTPGRGPAARFNLNTKGGDIRIARRESAAAGTAQDRSGDVAGSLLATTQAGAPVAAPPTPSETVAVPQLSRGGASAPEGAADLELEVLGALSRGEISVDEAMALLERTVRE